MWIVLENSEPIVNKKDEPVLVGIRPNEERVHVDGMSAGTRAQLYLALRLASLERYTGSSEPMPFIVDDVLVDFDDKRSEAALSALAELADKTQVVLFHSPFTGCRASAKAGQNKTGANSHFVSGEKQWWLERSELEV